MRKSEKTKRLEAEAQKREKLNFVIASTGVTLVIVIGILFVLLCAFHILP